MWKKNGQKTRQGQKAGVIGMENLAEVIDEQSLVDEALANFTALIDDFDFCAEMELLGIGRMQFLRRKQMIIEFKGLYIALWRLGLGSSFPRYADDMLTIFLRRYGRRHGDRTGAQIAERASQYWGMILPHGDANFNNLATHLISLQTGDHKDDRALTLKLALHIRSIYRLIFERLI